MVVYRMAICIPKQSRETSVTIKRILIIRIDRMGDLIVSTPAIQAIRQKFPDAEITYVLSDINRKILDDGKSIILTYHKKMSTLEKIKLIYTVIRFKPDISVCMSPKHFGFLLTCVSLAKERYAVIYSKNRTKPWTLKHCLTHSLIINRSNLSPTVPTHHGKRILHLLSPLVGKPTAFNYTVSYDKKQIVKGKFIGIHLDQRWRQAGWSDQDLMYLFEQIIKKSKLALIITADIKHYPELFRKDSICPTDCATLEPKLARLTVIDQAPYHLWVNIINEANAWLTAEGGSVHIAAAVNTPCVTWIDTRLYGKSNSVSRDMYHRICQEWLKPDKHHPIFHRGSVKKLQNEILDKLHTSLRDETVQV